MKLVIQAIAASAVIHIIYAISMLAIGYIQTKNYEPDFTSSNVTMLQNEVVFGAVYSPTLLLVTFIGVAIICGLVIILYKKTR